MRYHNFFTCSRKFLISNKSEQLEFKLEKKWDLETCRKSFKKLTSETKFNFRFGKGRRNQNKSISADPAVKKRGPVSQPEDLDETQIQFVSIPGPSRQKF